MPRPSAPTTARIRAGTYGIPSSTCSVYAKNPPSMNSSPCAKFTTPVALCTTTSPIATSAYRLPVVTPLTSKYASTQLLRDLYHSVELDLVALEVDPRRVLVALVIGVGARERAGMDGRLEALELRELGQQLLARQILTRALQDLDDDLGTADPEQVVDAQAITGEVLADERAILLHRRVVRRVLHLVDREEPVERPGETDLLAERERIGQRGLSDHDGLEADLLRVAHEDGRALRVKQHDDRVGAGLAQTQDLRGRVVRVRRQLFVRDRRHALLLERLLQRGVAGAAPCVALGDHRDLLRALRLGEVELRVALDRGGQRGREDHRARR